MFTSIDERVGVNLRAYREAAGLSQEELAQRMVERGFGFSQATVWKIESGHRPIKISEAVALADALQLRGWNSLTQDPTQARHQVQLQQWHHAAYAAFGEIKRAAAGYIEAQLNLTMAVREARDDGMDVGELWTHWLAIPAERAVIEARVAGDNEDEIGARVAHEVDDILQTLREHGHEAVFDPDQIQPDPQ